MLRTLCLEDMEPIRQWRNACLDVLRTPFALTKEQQEEWYRNEICNRNSRSRFFAIETTRKIYQREVPTLVGYGGIENIQWENSIGEISLLIAPDNKKKGIGFRAALEIINYGFNNLNLYTIFAECYTNNTAINFWHKVFTQYKNYSEVILPNRKYSNGGYCDSMYFSVSR